MPKMTQKGSKLQSLSPALLVELSFGHRGAALFSGHVCPLWICYLESFLCRSTEACSDQGVSDGTMKKWQVGSISSQGCTLYLSVHCWVT